MSQKSKNNKTPALANRRNGSTLSRYVSFVMLLITIVVFGFFFFNVIRAFLLPLFLATLLAVIFRPFHEWVKLKLKGKPTISAAVATAGIMSVVLIPLAGLVSLGVYEANQLIRNRKVLVATVVAKAEGTRRSLGLQKPFSGPLEGIEAELRELDDAFNEADGNDERYMDELLLRSKGVIDAHLLQLKADGLKAVEALWTYDAATANYARFLGEQQRLESELANIAKDSGADAASSANTSSGNSTSENEVNERSNVDTTSVVDAEALEQQLSKLVAETTKAEKDVPDLDEGRLACEVNLLGIQLRTFFEGKEVKATELADLEPEKRALRYILKRKAELDEPGFLELIQSFHDELGKAIHDVDADEHPSLLEQQTQFADAQREYDRLRTDLLGGPMWKLAIEALNPGTVQVNQWVAKLVSGGATRWLPSITNTATSLLTGMLVGLAIMAVALFYFFLDGSKMITALMHLSPLDDEHERELLNEFDRVSRAVVLATLLAAVAQGLLGAIGYRIVGLHSIFLLSMLTMILALIPFIGAAAIWVPCCLYLAFIREPEAAAEGARSWLYIKAGFLAVYGVLVISMADNVIKPLVLQGQSKLHPLLALLSVLGGVQALGPIGILVGPMVVAFLQVLLTILQREIHAIDEEMKSAEP